MKDDVRLRVLVLVGLAAFGAVVGATGGALGVGGPATDGPAAEFRVTDDNVTVADDEGRKAVIIADMQNVDAVQIADSGDGFNVTTRESEPLTDADRERAKRIARSNETVADRLEASDYELRVEPVRRLNASQSAKMSFEVNESKLGSEDTLHVGNVTVEDENSVTVERSPSFVSDRAVVFLERPDGNRRAYTAHVDFDTGAVTRVVDHTR